MIQINGVTKYYGEFKSLDAISAYIADGSIFGLVGSNGSGKSTLLRVMSGIFRADSGEVLYDGENVYENVKLKDTVVYLSDDQYFLPNSTLRDMAKMYASIYSRFSWEEFNKLVGIFGLPENRKINTFSKGMQKQAAILLGIAAKPRYLLCDETFDGLDPVMRQLVKRILAESVAANGITPIIASHNLRELEDICDHIGLLHKGGILFLPSHRCGRDYGAWHRVLQATRQYGHRGGTRKRRIGTREDGGACPRLLRDYSAHVGRNIYQRNGGERL